ncbi:MAG TPA: cell division protein FtsA [Candidatus Sulfotelmatobacter sp.]|nr:cell division protein FtsA [Candidatus Sulfotelmatobacter sp.]
MAVGRHGFIAGLDVGTTKVCCFVARVDGTGMRVVGIGHQVSKGMRSGVVVDMDAAEESIRAAVDAAERMADETVREVFVGFAGGQPVSHTVGVEVSIAGHQVGESDINRVLEHGRARNEPGERQVVHAIPVGYTIDGSAGIRDPRGMYGERLGVNMHVVTAATGPLRNLATCIERCHLKIAGTIIAPYASGLACLVEDEMDLGVTVIDMGGGTTSLSVFYDGALVLADVVAIGGGHVTNDIARGLSTPTMHAERMKTLYGSAVASSSDENEIIDVPQVGETEHHSPNHVPRSILVGIIKPRVEETFELVRDRLTRSGLDRLAGRRVVLCGGASQLQGVRDLAQRVLDKQVRMGRPIRVNGLAEATGGPAFATCAGLLSYALRTRSEAMDGFNEPEEAERGRFARLGQWLRANF